MNIVAAAAEGREIPPHWGLDREGRPTTDPQEALEGSVAPVGGHKGAALALMVEVLAGGLTGAVWSHAASPLGNDSGGPPGIGQLFIAIDPAAFGSEDFSRRLDTMLAAMTSQAGVRVPGERRHANRARIEETGVDVEEPLAGKLRQLTGEDQG